MGARIEKLSQVVTTGILLAAIFALLHLVRVSELLSTISRPMVVWVAQLFTQQATDMGSHLVIGRLVLPWTADCAGFNTLVLLVGVTLWSSRGQRPTLSLFLRLALTLPAALLANLFRILTLATYRSAFYPAWESLELHYFIGFIWLVPLLPLFIPELKKKDSHQYLEIFYALVVLSLLALLAFSPGGYIAIACALFFLASNRGNRCTLVSHWPAYLLWTAAAMLIAWAKMESLWLPWLLLCPRFVSRRVLSNWSGIVLLSGTIPLIAMQKPWQIAALAALLYQFYQATRAKTKETGSTLVSSRRDEVVLALLLLAPFTLPSLIGIQHEIAPPPPGIMARPLSENSYNIRVTGQPLDMSMYWYGSISEGRHHSLVTCMRFRGIELTPTATEQSVYEDGRKWMREFFIHNNQLQATYTDYLLATASPFSPPGVHIIIEAPSELLSVAYFARESERIVQQLLQAVTAGE